MTPFGERVADDLAVAEWAAVPDRAIALYRAIAPLAPVLTKLALAPGDRVFWNPARGEAWVQADDRAGRPDHVAVVPVAPPADSWVLVKDASFLAPVREAYDLPQRLLGGPNTFTNTLAGGLVGAGLGYGVGRISDLFLPEDHFEKGQRPGQFARIGAGLGAAAPIARGLVNTQIPQAGGNRLTRFLGDYGYHEYGADGVPPLTKRAIADYANDSAFMFADRIPVDRFNRTIWQDVGPQPGQVPPPAAALVTGLVAGTGAVTGKDQISISDLAWTAGTTAARGYVGGLAAAKMLGALAGLRPDSQAQLRRAGLWGGLVVGAVNALK